MAHAVESRADTPVNALRDLLDKAERELPVLSSSSIESYLVRMDEIAALFDELGADTELRTEETRWQDLQQRLTARAGDVVKFAGAAGGMAALRRAHPPAEAPWWHLDAHVAERRARTLKRTLVTLAVIGAVLLAVAFIYQRFLAPPPEVVQLYETLSQVERYAMDRNWPEALTTAETLLATRPDEPELLLWAGVIAEQLGDDGKAQGYLDRARQQMGDPLRFWTALGMRRMQAGDIDGAEAASLAALEVNAEEPQVYFILANVAEARGQVPEAVTFYERAAALADETNPQMAVVSKVRMGMLMQQLIPPGTPAATETVQP
jgi:Flp pilus assembly protein TadD